LRASNRRRGCRERRDLGSHGITDEERAAGRPEAARKAFRDPRCKVRQAAVREAGDGVLLVNHEWHAREPCGDAAGTGHESATAQHDVRAAAAQRAARLRDGAREPERRCEPAAESLAAQALDLDPFNGVTGRGHEARLDAALGAEPHDVATRAQLARDRERREHVASGAARHDHDRATHVERPSAGNTLLPEAATSWCTRSTMPIQASVTSMLERP
jgi:hypothetical protein